MSLYSRTGRLTLDMLEEARKVLRKGTIDGEPMKLGCRVDVLPIPRAVGEIVFGPSLREYVAVVTAGGGLEWQSTGKTILNYWAEQIEVSK